MTYSRQELPELDKRAALLALILQEFEAFGKCTSEATLLSKSPKDSSLNKMIPDRQDAYRIVVSHRAQQLCKFSGIQS